MDGFSVENLLKMNDQWMVLWMFMMENPMKMDDDQGYRHDFGTWDNGLGEILEC